MTTTDRVTSLGIVRVWHDDEGWGVIDCDDTPGGCWAHFSSLLMPGYRSLSPGQGVRFHFEAVRQDGYAFRATEAWPADQVPVHRGHETLEPSAYEFTVTLTVDDEGDGS